MVISSTRILGVWFCCGALAISASACTRSMGVAVGEEARRLNDSTTREQPPEDNNPTQGGTKSSLDVSRPITIHDSIALIVANEHKKRSRLVKKLLHNDALGKLPYESLAFEAERWSGAIGGFVAKGQDAQRQRLENVWWAADLALAYTRVNDDGKVAKTIAVEQLLLESVAGFWARLNTQRFSPIINTTRHALQDSLKRSNLTERERGDLSRLERRLFQSGDKIARRNSAFARNAGTNLAKSKIRGATLLPPPELLSITYTPTLFDRVVTSAMPPVKLGAKRSDHYLPRLTSLFETLNTMPYLGLFAVQPNDIQPFYSPSEEPLLLKVTDAVALSLIDLRYRKKNIDKQNYTQSRSVLVGALRMLGARIALIAYDRSLQQFSDSLWQFQQQERMLLRTKPSDAQDPRAREFLRMYSIHLISAIEASEAYAESLIWSLRLAFLSGYLHAPETLKAKNTEQLARNADQIEARLRQTPGLLHTQLESGNTRLVYGLPLKRRQALDRIIEARIAIQANAKASARFNAKPHTRTNPYATLPSMIIPDTVPGKNLFEQGSSIYRQLPRPSQEKNSPRLKSPEWLQPR